MSGVVLSDSVGEKKFTFAEGTTLASGSWVFHPTAKLGFELLDNKGAVWLVNAKGNRVLDAVHYQAQPDGFSLGRSPRR